MLHRDDSNSRHEGEGDRFGDHGERACRTAEDVADGGAAADAKARSAEAAVAAALGGADVPRQCAQLYVQVEQQTVVQNVELHQYQPRYLEENVDFGDDVVRAGAEMAASAKGKARQRYKPKQKEPKNMLFSRSNFSTFISILASFWKVLEPRPFQKFIKNRPRRSKNRF